MSDNIIEITENTNYSITIDTSLVQNDNNVVIELSSPNSIDIINNTTVLVSDLPQGYPLSWTTGNLPISRVSGLNIIGANYINVIDNNGTYTLSATGLQPSGNYSSVGHNHASSDITNFASSVSGLLPVKNISAGNGIGINNNNGTYSIAVTGTFGLTGEEVDDRVNQLLISGNGIHLNYNDSSNLTISTTGLQPSGNYSVAGHSHIISDVSGLQTLLDDKQPSGVYASGIHYHSSNDIINFNSSVDNRIILANLQPSGNYSIVGHPHVSSNITDFNSSVSGLLPVKNITSGSGINVINNNGDFTVAVTGQFGLTREQVDDRVNDLLVGMNNIVLSYDDNLDKLIIGTSGLQPSGNYSVIGHSHVIGDISGLQTILDNKQPSGLYSPLVHTHLSSDITDFNSSVNSLVNGIYAPLNSPSFSGTPTVPTASSGTNNSQIANTQFVRTEISNLVNSAPSTLDTLNELATALGNDPNFATTIASGLSQKSNIGHSHSTTDITNFNSGVSGLLPSVSGSGYVKTSLANNIYTISVSGLQPSGSYANSVHTHSYTDITDFASGIDNQVSTLLVAGSYINLNYDNTTDILTISATGVQPSGSYANSVHSHGNVSSSGTIGNSSGLLVTTTTNGALTTSSNITSSYISNFNSSVSGLLSVTNLTAGNYINVSSSGTNFTISSTGLQPSGNYSLMGHTHTSSNITDFNNSVSGLLPSLSGSGYVNTVFDNNIYTISVIGLQPSGNYSTVGHSHLSSDITDFNSSVSGLLPVTTILGGSNIGVSSSGSVFTVAVTGQLGLTTEEVDDRVASLLVAGTGIDLTYNDNLNALVITSVGSSPSGNYVLVGHTHTSSSITDFNSSVSGLLPVTNITGGSNISVSQSGTVYNVSVTGSLGLTTEEIDDRVSNLLVAGTGILLDYNDGSNILTINSSGLQPSGNYSLIGHTHTASDITNFNSSVSGLLPVTNITAGSGISVSSTSGNFTINAVQNIINGSNLYLWSNFR